MLNFDERSRLRAQSSEPFFPAMETPSGTGQGYSGSCKFCGMTRVV